jgi:hypothetical protein
MKTGKMHDRIYADTVTWKHRPSNEIYELGTNYFMTGVKRRGLLFLMRQGEQATKTTGCVACVTKQMLFRRPTMRKKKNVVSPAFPSPT